MVKAKEAGGCATQKKSIKKPSTGHATIPIQSRKLDNHGSRTDHGFAMNEAAKASWSRGAIWLLCAVLLFEFMVGMFPFSPVEGDEQAVINGIREMVRPTGADLSMRYDYPLQPGAYWMTIGVHAATGADCGVCYFALSAACALLFAWIAAALISGLSGLSGLGFAGSLALALLCQEIQRAACYANSSTIGGCLVLAGLLVAARRPAGLGTLAIAGALFGLGGWCRLDSLVLTPALLVILWRRETPARALIMTLQSALVTMISLVVLFAAIHVSLREILGVYSARGEERGYFRTLMGFHVVTSVGILLAAGWGAVICWRRHVFWPILLFVSVLIPTLYLYSKSLGTPKYFYYLTPFLALLAATGVRNIVTDRRRLLGGAVLIVAAAEWVTGLRTARTEVRRFTPEPTWTTSAPINIGSKRIVWVVGPGEILGNADGLELRTGLAFAGLVWHREKERALGQIAALHQAIDRHPRIALLTTTYASYQCAAGYLRQCGFECLTKRADDRDPASHLDRWTDGDRECWLAWINEGTAAPSIFADYAQRYAGFPTYFFNDLGRPYADLLLKGPFRVEAKNQRTDGFFTLYRLGD